MSIQGVASSAMNPSGQPAKDSIERTERATQPAVTSESKPESQPTTKATSEQIVAAAKQIDKYLKSVSRALEFRVDNPTGRTVVSVRDTETGDLIRQFPNEEVLRLAEMAQEQTVVLLKETV